MGWCWRLRFFKSPPNPDFRDKYEIFLCTKNHNLRLYKNSRKVSYLYLLVKKFI